MGFIGRYFGKKKDDIVINPGPFKAQIIFECGLVPQNTQKIQAAIEEFINKFPENIADNPRLTQASDGNVVEISLICKDKEELLNLNKELEIIATRYGLR